MIAFEILDVKVFMQKLLIDQTFDDFLVSNVEIITNTKFSISGDLNKSFYSSDELELIGERRLVLWKEIKTNIYGIIKGNRTPSTLKIVFSLSKPKIAALLQQHKLPLSPQDINGLYINILFENTNLKCTTGTSMAVFTLDKSLEQLWDSSIKTFFKKHEITVQS